MSKDSSALVVLDSLWVRAKGTQIEPNQYTNLYMASNLLTRAPCLPLPIHLECKGIASLAEG